MRILWSLLFFLLLSQPCLAQEHPSLVSSMRLEVVHNGTVETPRFRLEKVSFELLMPQRDVAQSVWYEGEVTRDDLGNTWSLVTERNPSRVFNYSKRFLVNISAYKTDSLPSEYEVPDDLRVYLVSSESMQADDPQIKLLAESLTNGSSSDFERVAALAVWVHDNVVYDIQLKDTSQDALWVLDKKVGTCDEYATLFIALARSIGIPARFVAGYYFGNGRWEQHAYAEVYLGKWVPVDPTNLDVGRLDAAHLRLAVSDTNSVGSRIRVYGADASKVEWGANMSVSTLNYTEDAQLNYTLSVSTADLSGGDSAVVVVRLMPEEYGLLRVNLQPCVSDPPLVAVDAGQKDVVLKPGKEAVLFWKLDAARDVKANMLYTCPLALNSKTLLPQDISLDIASGGRGADRPLLRAELSDVEVSLGSNQTVFLHIQNPPNQEPVKLGVIADGFFREVSVVGGQHASVSFKPARLGVQEVLVYSSTGSAFFLSYLVKETGGVYIESVEAPWVIKRGEAGSAKVFVRNSRPSAEDVKVYMTAGSSESIRSLSVADLSMTEMPFSLPKVGTERLVFRLSGGDFDSGTVREVRVYDVPQVEASAVYVPGERTVRVALDVSNDSAENVRVSVGDSKEDVGRLYGSKELVFNASEDSSVVVSYEDLSGKAYSLNVGVSVQEEGFLEALVRSIVEFFRRLLSG